MKFAACSSTAGPPPPPPPSLCDGAAGGQSSRRLRPVSNPVPVAFHHLIVEFLHFNSNSIWTTITNTHIQTTLSMFAMYVGMIALTAVNLKSYASSKPEFGIRENPSILICDIFPAVGSLPGRRTPRCRKECTSTRTVLPPENSGCKRWRYFYILHFTSWRTVDVDCRCENNRKKIAKRSKEEASAVQFQFKPKFQVVSFHKLKLTNNISDKHGLVS